MQHPLKSLLKNLWCLVSLRRRRQFILMLALTVLTSLAEIVSLGAVIPFIGILTQPEKVFSSSWLEGAVRFLNITSGAELVLPLAIGFGLAALVAGGMRLLLLWYSTQLANLTGTELSIEIYRRTLYQSYSVHISRSSSEIISGISQKTGVATSAMISVVNLITSTFLFLTILLALLIFNPEVSIISAIIFGSAYCFIALLTRGRMARNSQRIALGQTQIVRVLQEGLGAIRDVLLDGSQKIYCSIYNKAVHQLQCAYSENTFINQAPRYAMETLGMVLISLLVLLLSYRSSRIEQALPILAMLALGAQRLLPLMQQIYGNWAVVISSKAALIDVLGLLDQTLPKQATHTEPKPLVLNQSIRFENVGFRYANNLPWALDNLNLTILKGMRIGIIGSSGSGKSTLIDLLMGLLQPACGKILVDGYPIDQANQRAWQRTIAHVPQNIFLSDASISENIAFGIPADQIDLNLIHKAAHQAQIADFIESRPEGYTAVVGERGVRLSGGQRQRIGIARALYKNASVLIFDEATSALDGKTEKDLMQALEGLSKNLTLIIIAHRLTTLKTCDVIVKLDNGKIIAVSNYQEILNSNERIE
jgi:ABC-type bacteriocin/lantibiotic exporter with double-glycine peptidase domain